MKFELLHALRGLDERTPQFFKAEALQEGDETAKRTAARVLATQGDPKAVKLLKEILRIV
jgi:HEAT repeat protein